MSRIARIRAGVPLRLTVGDALIGLLALCLAAAPAFLGGGTGPATAAVITAAAGPVGHFDLAAPRLVRVDGPLGVTEVEIAAAGVRVRSSPCPGQVCVRRGWIRRPGQVCVCVPNRVVVELAGAPQPHELDGVSR